MTDPHTPAPSTASGAGLSEVADLISQIGRSAAADTDFPNYADCHIALPAGHWRAINTALSASRTSAATGWEDIEWGNARSHPECLKALGNGAHEAFAMARGFNAIARRRLAGERATGGTGLTEEELSQGQYVTTTVSGLVWSLGSERVILRDDDGHDVDLPLPLARAHPAPAPSAPGAGGELTAEELEAEKLATQHTAWNGPISARDVRDDYKTVGATSRWPSSQVCWRMTRLGALAGPKRP